jgi:Tfp pilus assembly protein PilF
MLAFCLGLSTNTFAVVYPGMTMLYDITFGKARKNYKLWLLFFLLAFLKLWLMRGLAEQRVVQVALDTGAAEFTNPLINVAHSIFSNLWLFIWPKNLTLYHEPLVVSQGGLRLELLALVAVILSLPFVFKKARVVFFALGLFILFLAPTYSPMMVGWLVAERYLYFPSIAFSLVIAFVAAKALKASRAQKFIITSALGILVVVYSLCTVIRNLDWKDHSSIWRATVKVSAQSPRAHNNMGDVYCLEGNLDKAAKEFTRAVELKPNYAETYHNLANTYQKMGKIDAAILNYQKAISINPQLWQSHQNLGVIYLDKGEPGLAKKHFQEALKMNPDNPGLKQVLKDLTSSTN